jgi:uncharacterized protein YndB with AHSA1/START domain
MVRHDPKSRPQTLERSASYAQAPLLRVAREVSHGRTTLVLTKDFQAGRDSVWMLLTDPERLRQWAPYTADRDLSRVGRCVLSMLGADGGTDAELPSVVLVADSPALLEHSWASDMLAWNITTIGSASRLTLHQTLADERMASANAAGWHLCLEVAESVLTGSPIPPMRGMEALEHGWHELNEGYATALGVTPSQLG